MRFSRRSLLVGAGAGGVLLLAYAAWPRGQRALLGTSEDEALLGPGIAIHSNGRVTVAVPQVETGQGIWTGLAQVAADELGAAWEQVAVVPALPSDLHANALAGEEGWLQPLGAWREWQLDERQLRITAGSTSLRAFEGPMRTLGAAARALLVAEAAGRWGVAADECDAAGSEVLHEGKRLRFGELAHAAGRQVPPDELPLRASAGKLAGRPLPRLDAVAKANGSLRFAADVRLPGMIFASVRTGGGARIEGPPPSGVQWQTGEGWVAALGPDWWTTEQALEAADVRTSGPAGGDDKAVALALEAALAGGEARVLRSAGDVEAAFAGARPLAADYSAGAALHVDLEPPSATARVSGGLVEVWAGTQAPEIAREAAARAAGVPLGKAILYALPVGGQGGRALEADLVPIAVTLASRAGRPVQVTMSRTEQVRSDAVRAPLKARLLARPMPDGAIAAWRMRVAGGDGTAQAMARLFGAGSDGFRDTALPALPYAIPNQSIEAVEADLPIRLGYHRGELTGPATFFAESFLDELARLGGRDPLAMRMALLGSNPRLARCLVKATGLAGWDGGGPGSQMGLAVLSAYGSHIAVVASASVGPAGEIVVSRMVAVADCGRAANPALVRSQIEGGLIAGLSQATAAAPSFRHGRVLGPLQPLAPTLAGTPELLVEILASRAAPGGVNGLGVAAAPAAVANALAAATGRRLRSLPLDPMS